MAVDITRENFSASLPEVIRALNECDFFAIDCEMTGLFVDKPGFKHEFLDDMQARYTKVAESSKAYIITQYGLSCFAANGEATSFNFYTFPQPHNGYNRRFLCDASSLAFLAEHGFDFNLCIRHGVPFMPIRTRDWQLQQVRRNNEPRSDTAVATTPEDKAFVADLIQLITDWLAGSASSSDSMGAVAAAAGEASGDDGTEVATEEEEGVAAADAQQQQHNGVAAADAQQQRQQHEQLQLPPMNSYKRLLAYQELRKPQFGVPGHPGFWVKKLDDARCLLLVRGSPERCAQLEAEAMAARLQSVHDAAGFAAVFDAMRRSGKPGVGHNLLLDVSFGLYSFADPYLPATWQDYKKMVKAWHLGGLYDTKYLARQLPEVFDGNTSLSEVYSLLTAPGVEELPVVRQLLAAASEAAGAPVGLPPVSHAPGCDKYRHLKAGEAAHEAGYDAFMTGAAFARMLPLVQGKIALKPNSELGQAYAKMLQQQAAAEAAKAADQAKAAAGSQQQEQQQLNDKQQPQQQVCVGDQQQQLNDKQQQEDMCMCVKAEGDQQQQQQQQQEEKAAPWLSDPLHFVRCVCGRLNLTYSDMAYAALLEEDPIPDRPTTFHFAVPGRPEDLWRQLQRAGLGQARVTVLDSSSCLVEFKPEYVGAVMAAVAEMDSTIVVTPWAEYARDRYHRTPPAEEDGSGAAVAAAAPAAARDGSRKAGKRPRAEEAAVKQEKQAGGASDDMDVDAPEDGGRPSRCSIM